MEEVEQVRRAWPNRGRRGCRGWLLALVLVWVSCVSGCADASPRQPAPAAPPASPPPVATEQRQVVVAVDDLGPGFNPHLLSDLSPVCTAVASLVLPSVFRPGPDGTLALDTTVASSAKVVSTAPFTVSYELSLAASWSDNTPIAAEDFVYLWERMRREPGVVDAAGYRLITDVRSRAGGKAVDVVFAQRYPAWQRLFTDLLPAHLLKDAPRSWSTALTDSVPVSGGPFSLLTLDRDRGQLVLTRNDHYWATPAVLDSLVLRRSDPTVMLDGLRRGELPVAQAWPEASQLAALRQLAAPALGAAPGTPPAIRLQSVAQPMVVQLAMRTDTGVLADQRIRHAVGALLDRDALIAVGTGHGAGGTRVDSQLLAPTTPGYRSTIPAGSPAHPDPKLAEQLLTSAGYQRDQAGHWMMQGSPLRVTIGTPTGRDHFQAVAEEARRQLLVAGIDAVLVSAPGSVLYTDPTVLPSQAVSANLSSNPPTPAAAPGNAQGPVPPIATPIAGPPAPGPASGTGAAPSSAPSSSTAPAGSTATLVDLEVVPRPVGADLATEAVSSYGCPPGMTGVEQPARNPSGFCSAQLQPVLDTALSTGLTTDQLAAAIEPILWRELPTIPLFQVVTTLASTPRGDQATGGIGPGPLLLGPFSAAASWRPITS